MFSLFKAGLTYRGRFTKLEVAKFCSCAIFIMCFIYSTFVGLRCLAGCTKFIKQCELSPGLNLH